MAEVESIVLQSVRYNREKEITGILMTSGGIFFQIIEGKKDDVEELYHKIVHDPRHKEVLLLNAEENVPERMFPGWSMKKINLDEESWYKMHMVKTMLENTIEQKIMLEKMISSLERFAWEAVTDP